MFVIKDEDAGTYYRKSFGSEGWYGPKIGHARVYQSEKAAQRVIDAGGHHVTYPGGRKLKVVPLLMMDCGEEE